MDSPSSGSSQESIRSGHIDRRIGAATGSNSHGASNIRRNGKARRGGRVRQLRRPWSRNAGRLETSNGRTLKPVAAIGSIVLLTLDIRLHSSENTRRAGQNPRSGMPSFRGCRRTDDNHESSRWHTSMSSGGGSISPTAHSPFRRNTKAVRPANSRMSLLIFS